MIDYNSIEYYAEKKKKADLKLEMITAAIGEKLGSGKVSVENGKTYSSIWAEAYDEVEATSAALERQQDLESTRKVKDETNEQV